MKNANKGPELTSRLDMVDGMVRSSGSLEGSRRLLQVLLSSWGIDSVLAFAAEMTPYIEALAENRGVKVSKIRDEIGFNPRETAEKENFGVDLDEIYDPAWFPARNLLSGIRMDTHRSGLALSMGPDYIVKIGEDAPTPDFVIAHEDVVLTNMYLLSRFQIAVECKTALKDMDTYFDLYRQAETKELWVFDPLNRKFEGFFLNSGKEWQAIRVIGDVYESVSIAGLQVDIGSCWKKSETVGLNRDYRLVSFSGKSKEKSTTPGTTWGDIAFSPEIQADPSGISFDEFVSWAPESKFEWSDSLIYIGSEVGSRNVIGMLAKTIGIREMVGLLPEKDWVSGIRQRQQELDSQETLRENLINEARKAASILKSELGLNGIALFGEWLRNPSISKWTTVKLVVPEKRPFNFSDAYRLLKDSVEADTEVKFEADLTRSEAEEKSEFSINL